METHPTQLGLQDLLAQPPSLGERGGGRALDHTASEIPGMSELEGPKAPHFTNWDPEIR